MCFSDTTDNHVQDGLVSFFKDVPIYFLCSVILCCFITEEHVTAMDANLRRINRDVLSHLDVDTVSSQVVVSSLPGAASGKSPKAICRSHSEEPEPKQSVPQHQETVPELRVKQARLRSQSPSSSTDSETSQKLSVPQRHECPPTRKRPAVTSLETPTLPDTDNPQPDGPLSAKLTCNH